MITLYFSEQTFKHMDIKNIGLGLVGVATLVGAGATPELINSSKELTPTEVQEFVKKVDYKKFKNADVLSKVHFSKKNLIGERSFTKEKIEFTVHKQEYKRGLLHVVFSAKRGNEILETNLDVKFKNPPLKVPDGTTSLVFDKTLGEEVEMQNFEYNPNEALKQILFDLVGRR